MNIGPNSPITKLPPLPPSTIHLVASQVLITLSGLGSQTTPLDEELELDELAADDFDELELATDDELELATDDFEELELTATDDELELTATDELELATDDLDELELTATDDELELTTAELAAELTTAELAAELTVAELELTATELELLLCFLLSLPPQAVIRTLIASTIVKCFTIAISPAVSQQLLRVEILL